MDYNDFPILTDEQYKQMQNKFNFFLEKNFDRKQTTFKIYSILTECKNSLPFINEKVNLHIKESLNFALNKLNKMASNFEATFNFSSQKIEVNATNLFSFLKKLSNLLKIFIFWLNNEQKEYFKQFSINAAAELTEVLFNILSALENSKIDLYKFM